MATLNDPNVAANVVRVGEVDTGVGGATDAQHTVARPIPTSLGHYRVCHRCVLVNAQAANSRLFEIRNTHASNLIVPTRLVIKWLNSAAHTAILEDSLDVFKVTGFSAVDTSNVVTLTSSIMRTSMGSDTTGAIRGVTVAGAAAGMTGGTLVKDSGPIGQLPRILNVTVMATTETAPRTSDTHNVFDDNFGGYPLVLVLNEGLIIENRVLLGAAAGSSVYVDFSYAVTAAY